MSLEEALTIPRQRRGGEGVFNIFSFYQQATRNISDYKVKASISKRQLKPNH